MSNTISVFEHDKLLVNQRGFNQSHFKALIKFNDLHGGKYFTVGFNKITFKSYVGVLQVGNKIIEVLPKADNSSSSSSEQSVKKWQSALLTMLQKAGHIRLNETEKALQSISKRNLLDIYLYTFLKETESLVHLGLVKKYHRYTNNGKVLKGSLLINKHIQCNLVHKERFYTKHTVYDINNCYNSILKKALKIIKNSSQDISIKQGAIHLLHYFEEASIWDKSIEELEKFKFDRKTEPYKYAISLAYLIIRNFCPDFSAGNHHILAILFDMNKLFESYVYKSLKKYESDFFQQNLFISQQKPKSFWGEKTIRPDIFLKYKNSNHDPVSFIVDTKWKVIKEEAPSDSDLKQMFVYNFQFGVHKSILFYPKVNHSTIQLKHYKTSEFAKEIVHGCELYFADLFDDNDMLSDIFAKDFLDRNIQ